MKIAYIYFNNIKSIKANTNQTLNMLNAFSKYSNITFFSEWISDKKFKKVLNILSLKQTFKIKKTPSILFKNNIYLEYISRFIYCLYTSLYLRFSTKYNIIFTRDFGFLYFLSFLPSFLKPKQTIIFESHKIYYQSSNKVNLKKEIKTLSQANLFIAIGKGVKEDLIKDFSIKKEKIIILPNGVNLNNFHKNYKFNPEYYGINTKEKIIIYSGSFLKNKGVPTIIKAIKYIRNTNYKIILVGGREKELENIKLLIKEENAKKFIILIDFLEQKKLIPLLQNSYIAILPNSKSDLENKYTSPLKLSEYMACKLAIIASDSINITDIATEKENYIYFKAGNPKDLAKNIDILLENKNLHSTISKNNFNKSKSLSWDSRAKNIIQFIKNNT